MGDRWVLAWGGGAVAFGGASLLVPLYILRLGATPFDLGLLAALAAVVGAPGAVVFGHLASQAARRRRLVVLTLGTTAVVLALIPLLTSITGVIVANAVLWLVVAAAGPVVTMLVVDAAAENEWSARIAAVNRAYGYGWAGGLLLGMGWPLLAGQLFTPVTAERALFWVLAGVAALSTLAASWTLPLSSPAPNPPTGFRARHLARLLAQSRPGIRAATFALPTTLLYWASRGWRRPRLRIASPLYRFFLAAGLFFAGFGVFWAPLPHLLRAIGLDGGRIFALYFVSSLASAVLYRRVGRVASRRNESRFAAGALAVRGLLFPVVALVTGLGATALGSVLLGAALLAIGVTWAVIAVVGTSIVTRLAPADARSTALGTYVAIGALAGAAGSILGGWLATVGYPLAFGVAGGLVVLGAALVATIRSPEAGLEEGPEQHAGDGDQDRPVADPQAGVGGSGTDA